MTFAKERGLDLIAITDEDPDLVRKFLADTKEPFPEIVAVDPHRVTFQGYGVSGTPSFVIVDPEGVVRLYQTGYTVDGGAPGPKDVLILETVPAGVAGQVVRFAVRGQPVVARLPLAGLHNARNAAAALAVAAALGLPPPAAASALADTRLPPHRSFPREAGGRIILDDCYNANPASMRAALGSIVTASAAPSPSGSSHLGSTGGGGARAFAVLGDMLELGPDSIEQHRAVGRDAAQRLAGLAVVGPLGAEIARGAREAGLPADRIVTTSEPATAAAAVAAWTRPGDWILVKASRGMRLERAVDALVENFASGPR